MGVILKRPVTAVSAAAGLVGVSIVLLGLLATSTAARFRSQSSCMLHHGAGYQSLARARVPAIMRRHWQLLLCSGTDLGPATSPLNGSAGRLVVSFGRTANELEWNRRTHRFSIVHKPRAARKVFAGHGIPPQWNLPITPSWFRRFYHGRNWGPALDPVYRGSGKALWLQQEFRRGSGTYANGHLTWKRFGSGPKPPWLYMPWVWHPIAAALTSFDQSIERHNLLGAFGHLNHRLRSKVVAGCVQNLLGVTFWPQWSREVVRTWSSGVAEAYATYHAGRRSSTDTLEMQHRHAWKITSVIRGRKSAVTCPPWSPPTGAFPGTFAVGDSVMVDAESYLQQMSISVNAAVSRQFDTGVSIIDQMISQGTLPPRVVIGLGTNGPMSQQDFDSLMYTLRHEKRVVVLTVREPRWWQDQVNAVIRAGVKKTKNGRIADWYSASANHPEYFGGDGIHLSSAGALVYAHQVANALLGP